MGFSGLEGTYYFKNFKLEKGKVPSPWCPNIADPLASSYGLDKVYDSSGFGNDGASINSNYTTDSITGNTAVSIGTEEAGCINFNYFYYKSLEMSFGGWFYQDDWKYSGNKECFIVSQGFLDEENTQRRGCSFNLYKEDSSSLGIKAALFYAEDMNNPSYTRYFQAGYGWKTDYLTSGWHHIFCTTNDSILKLYIDGKVVASDNVKKYYTATTTTSTDSIGRQNLSPFYGKVDDIRFYATALSENDVLQLYKEREKIDNQGNLYCSELSEVNINNYIEDWEDITKIKMSGWDGSKKYVKDGNYLLLTATNGWRTFGWDVEDAIGKNVIFEFDYSFEDITNWLTTPWIINSDEIQYGGTGDGNFSNKNEGWHHFRTKITSAKKFFGFNLRGTDNSGKNLSCRFRNIKIRDASDKNINFLSNGEIELDEIFEGNNQVKIIKDGNIIEVNEIYEN